MHGEEPANKAVGMLCYALVAWPSDAPLCSDYPMQGTGLVRGRTATVLPEAGCQRTHANQKRIPFMVPAGTNISLHRSGTHSVPTLQRPEEERIDAQL